MYSIICTMCILLLFTTFEQNLFHSNQYVASYTASAQMQVFIIFSS